MMVAVVLSTLIKMALHSTSNVLTRECSIHTKCRSLFYPQTNDKVRRFPVEADCVSWSVAFPQYSPVNYTDPRVLTSPLADKLLGSDFQPKLNCVDGNVDRASYLGTYDVVNGVPQNPCGRTGICGRGLLYRWGPNHAADPIVTRWKRDLKGARLHSPKSTKPVLQFVAIRRRDCGEWAIPGGMVDPGEVLSTTLKREFSEEALNSLECDSVERNTLRASIEELFRNGVEIYRGYVDDPRNTDNAWIETIAVNFHDETGMAVGALQLTAGDDAVGVQWTDITPELVLYASHKEFVETVARKLHADF